MKTPTCPKCRLPMVERKNGKDGSRFWGCQDYPECRGTRPYVEQPRPTIVRAYEPPPGHVVVSIELLRSARLLTHPDRHPAAFDAANSVTAKLNALISESAA